MQRYLAWRRLDGDSGHAVGRQLLSALYHTHVGGDLPEILVQKGGKPYFAEGNWHFSISHSKNHAFCALCSCPVGLDAEELSRHVNPALAEKVLSPGERRQYDGATDKNRALLTFWVMKEAAGKLSGRGIGFHPNDTDFMLTDSRVQEIDGALIAIFTQEDEENAF